MANRKFAGVRYRNMPYTAHLYSGICGNQIDEMLRGCRYPYLMAAGRKHPEPPIIQNIFTFPFFLLTYSHCFKLFIFIK